MHQLDHQLPYSRLGGSATHGQISSRKNRIHEIIGGHWTPQAVLCPRKVSYIPATAKCFEQRDARRCLRVARSTDTRWLAKSVV